MPFSPQTYFNPQSFSDYSYYTGLKGNEEMKPLTEGMAGVKPPESFSDLAQQAIAPAQARFDQLQSAAGQLQQGNVVGAVGTYRTTPKPTTTTTTGGFDFSIDPHR